MNSFGSTAKYKNTQFLLANFALEADKIKAGMASKIPCYLRQHKVRQGLK